MKRLVAVFVTLLPLLAACGSDEVAAYGTDHHNTAQAEDAYMNNLLFDRPGFDLESGNIDLNQEMNTLGEEALIDSGYLACDQMHVEGADAVEDRFGFDAMKLAQEGWDRLPVSYTGGRGIPDEVYSRAYSLRLAWGSLYNGISQAAGEELCPEVLDD